MIAGLTLSDILFSCPTLAQAQLKRFRSLSIVQRLEIVFLGLFPACFFFSCLSFQKQVKDIQVSLKRLNELVMITIASFKLPNQLKGCHERSFYKHSLGSVSYCLMLQNMNEVLPLSE